MEACYYCEESEATETRHGKPTCKECNEHEYDMITDPREERTKTEEDRASMRKSIMGAFKLAFQETWFCDKCKRAVGEEESEFWHAEGWCVSSGRAHPIY